MIGGATITYVERLKGPEVLAAMKTTGTTAMLVVPRLLRMFNDSIENKAAAAGVEIIVAVSAPTSLAIDFAQRSGITLVGFARTGRHNVYTFEGRVREPDKGRHSSVTEYSR